MATVEGRVDHTALKVNQASIITLLLIGFIARLPVLAAFVGLVMLVGTVWPAAGLFKLFYQRVLKPAGLLKPRLIPDSNAPHLFAQGMGGVVLAIAVVAFLTGGQVIGWGLAWVVIILAAVNLFTGFCMGCFIYYQLARVGIRFALPTWR